MEGLQEKAHTFMCSETDNMTFLMLSTKSLRRSECNFVHVESLETSRVVFEMCL